MATPIAHKGVIAGAKVQAMTILDILTKPELVTTAWDYFKNVQTKTVKYKPLIRPEDKPAIWLNQKIMAEYRPKMKKYYYDPAKYKTYLEQLGIKYPTVRLEWRRYIEPGRLKVYNGAPAGCGGADALRGGHSGVEQGTASSPVPPAASAASFTVSSSCI